MLETHFETDDPNVLPPSAEIFSEFEPYVGRLVLATAQLDLGLNFLLFELWPYISKQGVAKAPAFKLGNKLDQIEQVVRKSEALDPLAAELTAIIAGIRDINEVRTAVVHGALIGWRPLPEHALLFIKVDYSKPLNSYQGARSFVTRDALVGAAYNCTLNTARLHGVTDFLKGFRLSLSK